jgi:glutamine synthetase
MLLAAIDGVQNRIDPGPPLDKDIYDVTPEALGGFPAIPASL